MVAQNMAAQGRCLLCLMLSELVLFRTGCMIVARHVINCANCGESTASLGEGSVAYRYCVLGEGVIFDLLQNKTLEF